MYQSVSSDNHPIVTVQCIWFICEQTSYLSGNRFKPAVSRLLTTTKKFKRKPLLKVVIHLVGKKRISWTSFKSLKITCKYVSQSTMSMQKCS